MEQDTAVSANITIDQVARFAAQAAYGISATALISTIVAAVLWTAVEHGRIVIWLCVALLSSLTRLLVHSHYQKNTITSANVDRHKNEMIISLAVSGCVWGSTAIFLFPPNSIAHQVLLAFALGGMVAGSVNTFASILPGFYAFSVPAIVPLAVVFFSIGDRIRVAMGCMLLLFVFFMAAANRRINHEIYQFLVLKYENVDLIENLEKEIHERQHAERRLLRKNQQIESIVDARTAELRQVNTKLRSEITDRIEAEKALRESEKNYRELANSLPQIVFETDARGGITFANRNTFEILGLTGSDVPGGVNAFEIVVDHKETGIHEKLRSVLKGQQLSGEECTVRTKKNRTFPVSIHATPVMHQEISVGMRGIIIDLSEQKRVAAKQRRLQVQLQRAQKMEMLGTMAGGVAHDLNNILSGVVSYPDLMLLQLPPESPLRKPVTIMQESGKKAAAIVQDLLTLTRRGVVAEEVLNLNTLIDGYLKSPEYQKMVSYHPDVRVETSLDQDLSDIAGSEVHLIKTVMNLVTNAAEAMPRGGTIQIATANCHLDSPVKGYDAVTAGAYVILTVADDGIGIPTADIERIFEPFFTKKKLGRSGTGLGMAVVWGTVKDHNGYIEVTSEVNHGSNFNLYFPVTRMEHAAPDLSEPIQSYFGKGESILLVDDVPEQRAIASDLLTQLGYRVNTATCGEKAVEYVRDQPVDLIILDMIMEPGMDGLDTYREIIKLRPFQKAVIASGFSETERVKEALRLGTASYIKKPYTWVALGQVVQKALEAEKAYDQST